MSRIERQPIEEIDLLEVAAQVLARWKLLLAAAIIGAALAFGASKMMPKTYESTATIFVPESPRSLGPIRDLSVLSVTGGSTSGYLRALLQSETMARKVIADLSLMSDPGFVRRKGIGEEDFIRRFTEMVLTKDNAKGRLDIIVRARKPQLAADIANSVLDNLGKLVRTRSQRKADFIREKIGETSAELTRAEDEMLAFQERNDVASLDAETKGLLDELGKVDIQLLDLDVRLQAASSELANAGEINSLLDLEVRKRSIESSRNHVLGKRAELETKLARLPTVALRYARLDRRVRTLAKTYELLSEQYQTARISQYGEDGDYQIVDRAVPKMKSVAPHKMLNTLFGALLGFMIALGLSFGAGPVGKRRRAGG